MCIIIILLFIYLFIYSSYKYNRRKYTVVYVINRGYILHGCAEIQNFSSSVEKYFTSECSEQVKYFSAQEDKFCISKQPCNVLLTFYYTNTNEIPNHFTFHCKRHDLL